jgi:hypothetical protein
MTIQRTLFSFFFLILAFQSPAGTAQRKVAPQPNILF